MNSAAPDKPDPLPAAALAALNSGSKIDAIKIVREQTGLDLKDAKDLIERYLADAVSIQRRDTPASTTDEGFPSAATAALYKGSMIDAIRIVREQRHIGLKDAKEIVDRYLLEQPSLRHRIKSIQAEAGRRLLVRVIVIALLIAGGYYIVALLTGGAAI